MGVVKITSAHNSDEFKVGNRHNLKGKLSNENYVNKAPKNVVDADKKKLKDEKDRLCILKSTKLSS